MTALEFRDGWLMPAAVNPKLFTQWQAEAIERLDLAMPFVKQRRVAVQAGGNLGIWPRLLVERYGFACVFTFEPDETNAACLMRNLEPIADRVSQYTFALGAKQGTVGWSRASDHKPGWHKVAPVGCRSKFVHGKVGVMTVDELAIPADYDAVDLLALDIEGYEFEALKGAEQTIAQHRPVILMEDMGRSRFEGFRRKSGVAYGHKPGAAQAWLTERGYRLVAEVKNDEVWAPA